MALPSVPEEREQGAVQAQEAIEAAAPAPLEETPAQADEQTMAAIQEQVEAAVPPTEAQAPAEPQTNMWRIPHDYSKALGVEHKSVIQRQEDVGYLWAALAADPRAHPTVRAIAASLMGGR
jgi:hypothetical protein